MAHNLQYLSIHGNKTLLNSSHTGFFKLLVHCPNNSNDQYHGHAANSVFRIQSPLYSSIGTQSHPRIPMFQHLHRYLFFYPLHKYNIGYMYCTYIFPLNGIPASLPLSTSHIEKCTVLRADYCNRDIVSRGLL